MRHTVSNWMQLISGSDHSIKSKATWRRRSGAAINVTPSQSSFIQPTVVCGYSLDLLNLEKHPPPGKLSCQLIFDHRTSKVWASKTFSMKTTPKLPMHFPNITIASLHLLAKPFRIHWHDKFCFFADYWIQILTCILWNFLAPDFTFMS